MRYLPGDELPGVQGEEWKAAVGLCSLFEAG